MKDSEEERKWMFASVRKYRQSSSNSRKNKVDSRVKEQPSTKCKYTGQVCCISGP